jgi:8-oxo-dGTP pyrophosphatase MutT (NUDIX family)
MVAIPRDAATLILMRNVDRASTGIEILLVQRHARSAFMPGAYVFPGGAVETSDYTLQAERICRGLSFEQAQGIIADTSPPEKALGFFVAAIRETFEEAGILLANRVISNVIAFSEEEKVRFTGYRRQVSKDPFSFATIIEREGLKLATENLFYFAHWITPEVSPIRFDARFFVSVAPSNQDVLCDTVETTDHVWIAPQKALQEQGGDFWLPPPTLASIMMLAKFSNVDEVIAWTRDKDILTNTG